MTDNDSQLDPNGLICTELDKQNKAHGGRIEPGTDAWWEVWGACALDVTPGDIIAIKWWDGENGTVPHVAEHKVREMTPWPVNDETGKEDLRNSLQIRFVDDTTGETHAYGRLCRYWVFRRMTHHMLSPYAR